jgi:hypothetical protein
MAFQAESQISRRLRLNRSQRRRVENGEAVAECGGGGVRGEDPIRLTRSQRRRVERRKAVRESGGED